MKQLALVAIIVLGLAWNHSAAAETIWAFSDQQIAEIQAYLQRVFGNPDVVVSRRDGTADSLEVNTGEEFLGLIYPDATAEEGFYFEMYIAADDLRGH